MSRKTVVDGYHFWRVCPRCGKAWEDEKDWLRDTTHTDKEVREVISSKDIAIKVVVNVRTHGCGGKMLSPGAV